jgi:hypothetical protein
VRKAACTPLARSRADAELARMHSRDVSAVPFFSVRRTLSQFRSRSRSRFTPDRKYKSQEDRRETSPSLFSRRRDASLDGYV